MFSFRLIGCGVLALFVLGLSLWFYGLAPLDDEAKLKTKTKLETAVEQCDVIAEKSVAHLTAIVAFQKLEIDGRKINVMRRCMKDHGFKENPAWLVYAAPLAKTNAFKLKVSKDEALENLKRVAMYQFKGDDHQPLYWK